MGRPQKATGLLRRIDQQGLGLVEATQVIEAVSQLGHGLEPPLAGFIGLLPVDLVGRPVVRLALGIVAQVVIGLTDGEADGRLDLGLAGNEVPTSAAARSRTSSSVTCLAAGLFSGAAWRSSLSIRKWLIASALAAWVRAFFSEASARLWRHQRPSAQGSCFCRSARPVLDRSGLRC